MSEIIDLIYNYNLYNKHYQFDYSGEIVSFNQVYSGGHWSKRASVKNKYSKSFSILLLEAKVKPLTEMSLIALYSSRHDCDNLGYIMKMLVDTMKDVYIVNDGNKIYKSTHTIYDNSLLKGTIQFHIVGR